MLWHKKIQVQEVLIPITSRDTRTYGEKWLDKDYLRAVIALHGNTVFVSESVEAIRLLRNVADEAVTPEELAGVNKCIKIFKAYMVVAELAQRRLKVALAQEKAEEEEGE